MFKKCQNITFNLRGTVAFQLINIRLHFLTKTTFVELAENVGYNKDLSRDQLLVI